MSAKNLQIGSTVHVLNTTLRGRSRRDQWEEWTIVGETSKSWIAFLTALLPSYQRNPESYKNSVIKIPKNFEGSTYSAPSKVGYGISVALTPQAVEDDVWMHYHAHQVRERVMSLHDVDLLRKIAEILGYDAP
jgi:hypothetical protein